MSEKRHEETREKEKHDKKVDKILASL